jgi:hypothetical protein
MATSGPLSAGLDSGCGSRIGFINEELGTSFASADPPGFSHSFSFCADKSQDLPREEEGKVKASSKERGSLFLSYSRMCTCISFFRKLG